ncbi:prolactin-releasing peptide receptor [Onthophagus taurus]|uniref:prolactin-releasing peptide receptor n=1 Tax=Onthophagus taurus TaxID=166361 RepID=UPI0039BE366F
MNNNETLTDILSTTKDPFDDIPVNIRHVIIEFLIGAHVEGNDVTVPHVRSSVVNIYQSIICIYVLLIIVGVSANLAVGFHIVRHRLYADPTYSFIVNNVVSDIVKCIAVLPITLYVLLVENWNLGELLCSFLPMLQDIPLHTTTLTFLLMAWDRLRYVKHPNKPRIPAFVCTIGTWLTALCLVLPYPIYIIYVDLGKHLPAFDGVGICIVNFTDDMQEYMRGIFLFMYAAPLSTISYLYVKVSRKLQEQQGDSGVILFETRRNGRSRTDSHSTTIDITRSNCRGDCDTLSDNSRNSYTRNNRASYRESRFRQESSEDLDISKETRTQKYLVLMVTMYAVFLCPLMILRVARLALIETYENTAHFDITYTMLVWIAFLHTCSTPILFASWQMSRPSKERLRGYFRFSNRKLRRSCDIPNQQNPGQHRSSVYGIPGERRGDLVMTGNGEFSDCGSMETS